MQISSNSFVDKVVKVVLGVLAILVIYNAVLVGMYGIF